MTEQVKLYDGCFGRLRDGTYVGPIKYTEGTAQFPFEASGETWTPEGKYGADHIKNQQDIVEVFTNPFDKGAVEKTDIKLYDRCFGRMRNGTYIGPIKGPVDNSRWPFEASGHSWTTEGCCNTQGIEYENDIVEVSTNPFVKQADEELAVEKTEVKLYNGCFGRLRNGVLLGPFKTNTESEAYTYCLGDDTAMTWTAEGGYSRHEPTSIDVVEVFDQLYTSRELHALNRSELCVDEGCPQHGIAHVCVNRNGIDEPLVVKGTREQRLVGALQFIQGVHDEDGDNAGMAYLRGIAAGALIGA